MSVHTISKQGRRPQNEDKHKIILNINSNNKEEASINFYGIYDGHGGKYISNFLYKHLSNFFINKKITYPINNKYIMDVYKYIQNILRTKYKKISTGCGSTCLIVIHYKYNNKEYFNIINTGDSRCIICTKNIAIALTKDHKPNKLEEILRIKKLGGKIIYDGFEWRINNLSVSRAFGDIDAEPYVTNLPDIFNHRIIKDDKFIVLACDGLWDVLSNQKVVNIILASCYDINTGLRINKKLNIANKIAELAILNGSTDNVTVIVIFID